MPTLLGGRQTQFYIDVLYGLAFSAGFGYLLVFGMDARVAAFQGGIVLGYFLRVWENMHIYERILEEEISSQAQEQVEVELETQVPEQIEEEVETQAQEQLEAELETRVPERIESGVEDHVADEVEAQISGEAEERIIAEAGSKLCDRIEDIDEGLADQLRERLESERTDKEDPIGRGDG